ncbi:hypothetical protein Q5P01_003389 [Channa striata]|uniref:Uncharacterized protein n=1 Tax=Channa striata TaxID=64152 RepID=A0AA88NFU0_CHASR|nr:hypothetical protein Q5P01_003389 [Channa striata]
MFSSFLNRSILAAVSSLMGDPGFWFGAVTTRQKQTVHGHRGCARLSQHRSIMRGNAERVYLSPPRG